MVHIAWLNTLAHFIANIFLLQIFRLVCAGTILSFDDRATLWQKLSGREIAASHEFWATGLASIGLVEIGNPEDGYGFEIRSFRISCVGIPFALSGKTKGT